MSPPPLTAGAAAFLLLLLLAGPPLAGGAEILSKSRLERCARDSGAGDRLTCDRKIVLNMAIPSGSSGGEASLVAQVVEVEENDTQAMQTIRDPPVITINKSAAYALYELTYIRDVAYKPEELFVKTRKCEPDAGEGVVKTCERLRDPNGHIIEHTEPICCPCGPQRRVPSSCGNFFDKLVKGKANTAHCLRFPDDWFHVFGVGTRSLGFSIRIQVKKGSSVSEVIVGPENRTVLSKDNFLRVNLVGDFVGYTSVPSFEDFYLVTPRMGGGGGQPQVLGNDFSKWMLLERVRFTLDGLECNKIGVGYEAYKSQPNFCSSPFWSCLYNQLWNFWEADKNRISRKQQPQYIVQGRFQRINQHPNAGVHSFSVGITEVLNTNLLIELSADDIEYVYQRSPGKIISISIPTFEALTQFGTAQITTKNIGKLEASYRLTFDCLSGINYMEEQFFIMKPDEVVSRSFYLHPTTDQAVKYRCAAILKASDFSELDRAECQFTTTATVLDNGSQIVPFDDHKKSGIKSFFEAIKIMWSTMWGSVIDFFTGRSCSSRCSSFFDFSCHVQYICVSWIVMFGLLLAILPAVIVLLWLLHQKGFFDPLYDWWEDRFGSETRDHKYSKHKKGHKHTDHHRDHYHKHHKRKNRKDGHSHHILHKPDKHDMAEGERRRHRHDMALGVHKEGHKHRHSKASTVVQHRHDASRHRPLLGEMDSVDYKTWKQYDDKNRGHKHDHDHRSHRKHLYSKTIL